MIGASNLAIGFGVDDEGHAVVTLELPPLPEDADPNNIRLIFDPAKARAVAAALMMYAEKADAANRANGDPSDVVH